MNIYQLKFSPARMLAISVFILLQVGVCSTSLATDSVVFATNFGGPAHQEATGVQYQPDELGDTGVKETGAKGNGIKGNGIKGEMDTVIGAQDGTVFKTYREGDFTYNRKIANGRYDIMFQFAEPHDIPIGGRVFSVFVEGQRVITDMDVRLARDGNSQSAVFRSVTDIQIDDGELNISFTASRGKPLLNALVVRKQPQTSTDWQLSWQDEFDYEGAPSNEKWNMEIWPAGKVNDEQQAYTERRKNVRVENGLLVLEAHQEDYANANYTSGRIQSLGKGDFLYGRADIRARLPAGQGTWPAIWMLSSEPAKYSTTCSDGYMWDGEDCDAWPNSGEIDIMEHVGYDMNRVHGTVHTKAYYWVNGKQRKASVEARNVDQEFHIYSIEWAPERIDIFLDGSLYFTYLNQGEGWQAWPFDHPYHMILNLAIGGGWGGAGGPTDNDIFPVRMEVDYVRIYSKVDNS